jgi:membrane fusion protein, multidrug efflux system
MSRDDMKRHSYQPRNPNEMSIQRRDILKVGGLALVLATAACNGSAEAGSTPEQPFERVINVVVETLEPEAFVEQIALTGTVEAARDVTVSAEESGVVRELLVARGASVREGQPLVRIDDAVLRPQVERARAEARLAQEQWERRRRLFEEDQVGSELAYLEARLLAEQAAAQLAVLEERLARTLVRAPFSGVVEERFVEVGSMVAPGAAVARILQLDPVKITAGVPERYATDVRAGASVEVSFDVLPGETFDGSVGFVGSAVNPRNRTFPVEVALRNPGGMIKPEMVANVSLVRRVVVEALVVPQEAIVRVSDGHAVFVVRREGALEFAEARSVTLGASQRNLVAIASGLEPGDRIIVVGQKQVAHGDRVRVVEER